MYREVIMVLDAHKDKAIEEYAKVCFTEVHAIPYDFGKFCLVSCYIQSRQKVQKARATLVERGVPYNAAVDDEDPRLKESIWLSAARFNSEGGVEREFSTVLKSDELFGYTLDVMLKHQWPDGARGTLAELRAHCVAINRPWCNQIEYGGLHAMLKILGTDE